MKILIIQTAFIGDVILSTPVIEKLHQFYPNADIDFLLSNGNEHLLENHPYIHKIHIFNKQKNKYFNLFKLIKYIRAEHYDWVINIHRFFSSGLITVFSGAKHKIGFKKNPLSFFYHHRLKHQIGKDVIKKHEIHRNLSLIERLTDNKIVQPKLYPSTKDYNKVATQEAYICIAPTSVWYTKQWSLNKWLELIMACQEKYIIYLLGSRLDVKFCEQILEKSPSNKIKIMAGRLSLLESAALIKHAVMNFVNDSAALHLASAMNAPVTAIYCSTIPEFGFSPLSTKSYIVQTEQQLNCKPCGLHGRKSCPKKHFKCSDIKIEKVVGKLMIN